MKLWLLETKKYEGPLSQDGAVVRAETDQEAVEIVARLQPTDTLREFWLGPEIICHELTTDGDPGVVLESYTVG